MKRVLLCVLCAWSVVVLAGCGGGASNSQSSSGASSNSSSSPATSSSSGATSMPAVSKYDSGPRAGESPVNDALVEPGEKLFSSKGCTACHAFGKRLTGPDLTGVTMRRTAEWMENQILHPDKMVKEDPISHGLFATYALQMPNQGLTPDEAKAVIEYFKHKDKEAGEKKSDEKK